MSTANDDGQRDDLLTVDEACIQLSISKSLLRGELLKHRLPVVRIGRRLFIPSQTCDDLIRLGMRPFQPHVRGRGQ
jgi:excisionase family DNA binding protein